MLLPTKGMEHGAEPVYATKGEEEDGNESMLDDLEAPKLANNKQGTGSRKNRGAPSRTPSSASMERLVRSETKAVQWSKWALIFVFIVVGSIVASVTYWVTNQQEVNSFRMQFLVDSARLIDGYRSGMANRMLAMSGLIQDYTNYVDVHSSIVWPNVTRRSFESTSGAQSVRLAQAGFLGFAPALDTSNVHSWEAYAAAYNRRPYPGLSSFRNISQGIWRLAVPPGGDGGSLEVLPETYEGPHFSPIWQLNPMEERGKALMFNQFSEPFHRQALDTITALHRPALTGVLDHAIQAQLSYNDSSTFSPRSMAIFPVLVPKNPNAGEKEEQVLVKAFFVADLHWASMFERLVFEEPRPLQFVVKNTCGQVYTFHVDGSHVYYDGEGDLHDDRFDSFKHSTDTYCDKPSHYSAPKQFAFGYEPHMDIFLRPPNTDDPDCQYNIHFYPTKEFEDSFLTHLPLAYTITVVLMYIIITAVFAMYDCMVEKRQSVVMDSAVKSNAIVSSLFPPNVRGRLMALMSAATGSSSAARTTSVAGDYALPQHHHNHDKNNIAGSLVNTKKARTSLFHHRAVARSHSDHEDPQRDTYSMIDSTPIADMFSDVTVIFADIAGFTAWSSEREPYQVFHLLETLYGAFDAIANRLGVFKVETIGDCYVAATGLPTANPRHATVMARFAIECLDKMNELKNDLEVALGPGTSDLKLRVGLHSGPLIAGVLRGEKSRFQLFGDTMNTAARMESTGEPGRIHLSKTTAELLLEAGKSHWLSKREELVRAKGKGQMQTYWLENRFRRLGSALDGSSTTDRTDSITSGVDIFPTDDFDEPEELEDTNNMRRTSASFDSVEVAHQQEKRERLIEWNASILLRAVQRLKFYRDRNRQFHRSSLRLLKRISSRSSGMCSDELPKVVEIADFNPSLADRDESSPDRVVETQVHTYVSRIADLYRDLPFHNFEHACHVMMSAVKLLNRIVSGNRVDGEGNDKKDMADLHNSTFGISSDPLVQFVIVLAALIHDVDHHGVSNQQLVKDEAEIAVKYNGKSVLERHSLHTAVSILMEPPFKELCNCIFQTDEEQQRFNQLLVNAVLATDVFDNEAKQERSKRWLQAFGENHPSTRQEKAVIQVGNDDENADTKAMLVLEHIIQASDVAHTMQHWHIFCSWNERLFQEMFIAHRSGRSSFDPCENWYTGQILFLERYVIPLARNLKECGVFGVYSDECLVYALQNLQEWVEKGVDATESMKANAEALWDGRQAEQQPRRSCRRATTMPCAQQYHKTGQPCHLEKGGCV